MIDITLRHTFDGAGTSTARNVSGPSLLVQTTVGVTATVQGSNLPEIESSWQTLGTASGLAGVKIDCPFAFVRVTSNAAGTVSVSAPEGGGAGSSTGSGSTTDRELVVTTYVVKTAFTGGSVGDTITCTQVLDVSAGATTVSTVWRNQTTAADLASTPSAANLTLVGAGGATESTLSAVSAKLSGQGTPTNRSGTITAGGTAQQLVASNAARVGLIVQNLSTGDLWVNDLGTASAAQPSIKLAAGAYWEAPPNYATKGAVSIFGATTGQAFVAREY